MNHVDAMQQELERALQQANRADDRELAGRLRDDGRRFVFVLNSLIKMSRLHLSDNVVFDPPAIELSNLVFQLLELLGVVHLVCVEDQIYLNDVRLRVRPTEQASLENLVTELDRHEVGGMTFHSPLGPDEVKLLARALAAPPADGENPRAWLAMQLTGVEGIELAGRYRFQVGGKGGAAGGGQSYLASLHRGVSVIRAAERQASSARMLNPLPVRRSVIELVDRVRERPGQAAAEPLRRRKLEPSEHHMLSVCNLAILLGQTLRLPDGALSDLGVAAMMHDLGAAAGFDHTDHTRAGVRLLLRQRGFHEAKVRRMRAVLEHHLPYHVPEGAPAALRGGPSLFSRILHIVDDYDLLVSARSGQVPAMSPFAALRVLWPSRGAQYDPTLLTLFVQTLGLYPAGTLLELTDGRWVMVVSGGQGRERFGLPVTRVVRGANGRLRDGSEEVDLYLSRERLRPLRVIEPSEKGVDVAAVLDAVFGTGEAAA